MLNIYIYICAEYIFANLLIALWCLHVVLHVYLPYGAAHARPLKTTSAARRDNSKGNVFDPSNSLFLSKSMFLFLPSIYPVCQFVLDSERRCDSKHINKLSISSIFCFCSFRIGTYVINATCNKQDYLLYIAC